MFVEGSIRNFMCVATLYFYLGGVVIMINVVLTVKLAILHTMYISMTSLCMTRISLQNFQKYSDVRSSIEFQ